MKFLLNSSVRYYAARSIRFARGVFYVMLTLSMFFLLCCFPAAGLGETDIALWISPTGEHSADAIEMQAINNRYYMFLPGSIDLADYKLGFQSYALLVNGQPVMAEETPASILLSDKDNELVFETKYLKKNRTVTLLRGSKLPSLYITTESGSLRKIHYNKKNKEKGKMVLYDADGFKVYEGSLKHLKMRGNASTKYQKKNYIFKLDDGASLLGMGKAKKWILIGNHLDKSLIRNQMSFDMARYVGLEYTPDCQQTAVYINNEYLGIFLLTEKIEIDDDRVDIHDLEKATEELNSEELESYPIAGSRFVNNGRYKGRKIPVDPDDITGGYIIEYSHFATDYENPSVYYTKRGMCLRVHSPEFCSEAQIKYISGVMQSFENAIFSKDGIDPVTGKHYSDLADMDSLLNKFLINEVSKNYDMNMQSEYFYKPDDSVSTKIFAGPVWDLDNTYGDYARKDIKQQSSPVGLMSGKRGSQSYWWPELYQHDEFREEIRKRYHERFVPALEILLGQREETDLLKSIDTYAAAIEDSVALEYIRYPHLKGVQGIVQTGHNLAENVEYLKTFITQRMTFLEGEWPAD